MEHRADGASLRQMREPGARGTVRQTGVFSPNVCQKGSSYRQGSGGQRVFASLRRHVVLGEGCAFVLPQSDSRLTGDRFEVSCLAGAWQPQQQIG